METLQRTLIILLAAAVVVLATLPLAQTDWADGMRSGAGEGEGAQPEMVAAGGEAIPAAMRYVLPFVKTLVLMGIPGMLTLLVRWIMQHALKAKRSST